MRKVLSVFLAVFFVLMSSVPAMAAVPFSAGSRVEDGNTYLGLFDTASASAKVKDFLVRWSASDSNILSCVPSLNQIELSIVSNPDVKFSFRNDWETNECIDSNPALSIEIFVFRWNVSKKLFLPRSTYVTARDWSHFRCLVGGTFFSKTNPDLSKCDPNRFLSYEGNLYLKDNAGILDGYNVSSLENPKRLLSIKYQYENGTTAIPTYNVALAPGAAYSVPSPNVLGYAPGQSTVSGTMPNQDLTVTVTYLRKFHQLSIQYQYENGTSAGPTHTESIGTGLPYSVFSPRISGYTPDRERVIGEMPDRDLTETVVYIQDAKPPDPPVNPDPPVDPPVPPPNEAPYQYRILEFSMFEGFFNMMRDSGGAVVTLFLKTFLLCWGIYTAIGFIRKVILSAVSHDNDPPEIR